MYRGMHISYPVGSSYPGRYLPDFGARTVQLRLQVGIMIRTFLVHFFFTPNMPLIRLSSDTCDLATIFP